VKTEAPAEAGTTATETQDTREDRHRLRMALLRRNLRLPESVVAWWRLEERERRP
jgi:hypothetical protein